MSKIVCWINQAVRFFPFEQNALRSQSWPQIPTYNGHNSQALSPSLHPTLAFSLSEAPSLTKAKSLVNKVRKASSAVKATRIHHKTLKLSTNAVTMTAFWGSELPIFLSSPTRATASFPTSGPKRVEIWFEKTDWPIAIPHAWPRALKKGFNPAEKVLTFTFSSSEQSARCSADAWVASERLANRIPRPIPEGMLRMIQSNTVEDGLRRLSSVNP